MSQTIDPDEADPSAASPSQPEPAAEPGRDDQPAPGYPAAPGEPRASAPAEPAAASSQAADAAAWTAPGSDQAPPYGQAAQATAWTVPGSGQAPPYGQPQGPGYGQVPAYAQGFGAGIGWTLADSPSPILVRFADPAPQNRVTVLFRIVMAIPHLVVLYALNLALEIIGLIGWFAALFTGALPEWAHTFITGVLRWQTRVHSYLSLLTDAYPPFSLDDTAYPVRLLTRPTRLNRLAVFFRIILVFPASIVAGIASLGFVVLSFFGWLIALVTGQLPPALHQAGAAIVRYTARYGGFFYMVTSEYPKGLYGDPPIQGFGVETSSALGGETPAQPEIADTAWPLTLSSAAKSLVTVALVLGVGFIVAYIALIAVLASNSPSVTNALALARVEQANVVLSKSIQTFPSAVQACNGQLSCVTALDRKLGTSLGTFAGTINSIGLSGAASSAATRVVSDSNAAAQDLGQLGAATSVSEYQSTAANGHLQQDLNNLSADYTTLTKDLGAS
jgi:hypothetical protein